MVTRSFGDTTQQATVDLRAFGKELRGVRSGITGTILPALGLSAAFSVFGGGLNDATSSGRAASSAMFEMQASLFGVQEALTRAILPAIEEVTPIVAEIAEKFVEWDDATNGWSTRAAIAGVAAYALRGQLVSLGRAAITSAAAVRAATLGGPAALAAAGAGGTTVGTALAASGTATALAVPAAVGQAGAVLGATRTITDEDASLLEQLSAASRVVTSFATLPGALSNAPQGVRELFNLFGGGNSPQPSVPAAPQGVDPAFIANQHGQASGFVGPLLPGQVAPNAPQNVTINIQSLDTDHTARTVQELINTGAINVGPGYGGP